MSEAVQQQLKKEAAKVEAYLVRCIASIGGVPEGLAEAMNYSLLAGGKRIRPVLCLTFAKAFNRDKSLDIAKAVMPFAAAIECIHSYSLIHDDLPAMDNDDMRRGRPTNHKQFSEATAILAGDALVTDAFTLMASVAESIAAERVLKGISCFARAAGSPGMVGGQFLDMLYTGAKATTFEELRGMHAMKTGALLQASCVCGAILAGADEHVLKKVAEYGRGIGAAFQIVDDILDEIGDQALLGKPVGSDAVNGKTTYPSLLGLEASRALARKEAESAILALPDAGAETAFLQGLAGYIVSRVQ